METSSTTDRHSRMAIDHEIVGQRLELVRIALGLQKRDFAIALEIDPSSYSKIISGSKPLKADHAAILADKWSVPMDYIFRGRLTDLPDNVARAARANLTQQHR